MICTDNAYIERIEKILDKQYWMDKVPEATLNERFIPSYYPEQEIVDPLTPKHKQRLHKEGYFFVKQALHSEITLQLKNIICSLHAQDIHPIFSFVFDDFWKLVNLLKPYVEPLLGRCHTMIPASWVWRIDPQKEEKDINLSS